MALARQRSRSPLRLPTAHSTVSAPSLPKNYQVEFKEINRLELAIATEIDRQENDHEVYGLTTGSEKHIHIKITKCGQSLCRYSRSPIRYIVDINQCPIRLSWGTWKSPMWIGLLVHQIVTRYGVYEMASSPMQTHETANELIAVYRRRRFWHGIDPFMKLREDLDLQEKAAEGEALRAKVDRMKALYGTPKCFLGNTAFRQPDGSFKLARDLVIQGTVKLENGRHAQITHAEKLTGNVPELVELTTEQATLRISANHPIETVGGPPRAAKQLQRGDRVVVGNRIRKLTKVRSYEEGAELFDIRFSPDGPIQAYVLPNYGIHVHGAAPPDPLNLVQLLQNVPLEELMQALPEQYDD